MTGSTILSQNHIENNICVRMFNMVSAIHRSGTHKLKATKAIPKNEISSFKQSTSKSFTAATAAGKSLRASQEKILDAAKVIE